MKGELFRPVYSRRFWARVGYKAADFLGYLVVNLVLHLLNGLLAVVRVVVVNVVLLSAEIRAALAAWRRRRREKELDREEAEEEPVKISSKFSPLARKPGVAFNDIAGLDEAKRMIREMMVFPALHPELARTLRIRPGGSLLLIGPPGTGKTMLAEAVATEVDALFFSITPSDITSGRIGDQEGNVKELFQEIQRHRRAVLFIDEVESLTPKRGSGSTVMDRVVPQFLQELDGISRSNRNTTLLLIGSTNKPWLMDEAVRRSGRFNVKVIVGPPETEARMQILENNFRGRPLAEDVDLKKLAEDMAGYSGADLKAMADESAKAAFSRSVAAAGAAVVQGGTEENAANLPTITLADIEEAKGRIRKSIPAAEMRRFQRFMEE